MNELIFRRRTMTLEDGQVYVLGASSGGNNQYFSDFVFEKAVNEQPIPLIGGHTIIFTRNIDVIRVYKEDQKFLDYYGIFGSQVDTGGRNVRQVTLNNQTRYVGICLRYSTLDDSYVYEKTEGKYLYRGKNIPSDYIPEIAS